MYGKKIFVLTLLLLICLGTANLSVASVHPSPNQGNDLQNSSRSLYDTSHLDGTVKWTFQADEPIDKELNGLIIGSSETIYFVTTIHKETEMIGHLYSINSMGELVWKADIADDRISACLSIGSDGNIYVPCYRGFRSFNTKGDLRWTSENVPTVFNVYSPTVAVDDFIILLSNLHDSEIYAIDINDNLLWNYDLSFNGSNELQYMRRAVVGLDGIIYLGAEYVDGQTYTTHGYLYAMNQHGIIWRKTMESGVLDVVYGDNDTIYVSCMEGNIFAFNTDGDLRWSRETDNATSIVLGQDGEIIITETGSNLAALNPNGEEIWELNLPHTYDYMTPIGTCSGGIIYALSETNESSTLHAISSDHKVKWTFSFESNLSGHAIGSDGTFYLLTSDGLLYAFGGEESEIAIVWIILIASIVVGTAIIIYLVAKSKGNHGANKSR